MEKALLSVVGPTAMGKTKLAISLAQKFRTEIISADSRQFFREMKIGTAVPSAEELNTVKHHFIHCKSIHENYSVGSFEREATTLLTRLFKKNDVVVMVGGSGLYIDAVTKGLDEFPEIDPKIREELNLEFEAKGIEYLKEELKRRDPSYYEKVDLDNPHRLIRALEVCLGSGRPYSSFLKIENVQRPYRTITIGIQADREIIYDRINKRVDLMMQLGLLEEAKSLYHNKSLNALQTVGYKELFNFLDGIGNLDFAVSEIKKNTRRFAKRQLTWFRKDEKITWVEYDDSFDKTLQLIHEQLMIP